MIVTLTPIQLMLGSEVEPLTVYSHNTVGMYMYSTTIRVEILRGLNFKGAVLVGKQHEMNEQLGNSKIILKKGNDLWFTKISTLKYYQPYGSGFSI